ncbi:hypothetical protein QFZ31_005210 [Neobacillus niacini]|jgi:hypothetical protein|uniref:hypothetical protein n=1 Tax=Neobacillus driksii TaxID=3035913 RepID=UPI0027881E9F|nr:hypothetical protein [Neobacillus niacini]MDQ0975332.1 hypothetical protein [Neobacillus niacini]
MVNENFNKFRKEQQEHQSVYLGGANRQRGKNDPDYNNQEITDKTVGATGRSTNGKVE